MPPKSIKNSEIAKALKHLAFLTEMEGDANAPFRARAYYRASDTIASLAASAQEIYDRSGLDGLLKIPSIGKAIAGKIGEYIEKGSIKHLDEMKAKTPIDIDAMYGIEGVGPKTIKAIYDKLGVRNLVELEQAAGQGRLRTVPGFSERKENEILRRLEFFKKGKGRRLIGELYPLIKQIEARLSQVAGTEKVVAAGSVRRMKETIGDIDFIALSADPEKLMEHFVGMPEVEQVLGRGQSKAFVRLSMGIDADLLVVPRESWGSALQYFTGSKEHSIELRRVAIAKGLRLNEWGVFNPEGNMVAGRTEQEVYNALGLQFIPPEMRENNGEITLAKEGKVPCLIEYGSLKGDLQVHSNSTDGTMSIEDMAVAAREKFGLKYIAITDHTKSLALAGGLNEEELLEQAHKIGELNDRLDGIRVLSAAEVNIMKDGSLDIPNSVLDKLDVVGAAIHSNFAQPIEVQTDRLIKAAKNPSVDILFHPTGRLINRREGYPVDIEKVIETAVDTKTVLEIDAHYNRLDLKDDYVRMAVGKNAKLVIDSDAHHPAHFAFLLFGTAQARRGWARAPDILNTLSADRLLGLLK